jgi:integrase
MPQNVPKGSGRKIDVARLLAVASPEMELALMLALWTGQRQGDLLMLSWAAYDGSHIRLRQSKTGAAVMIRVGAPLRALLDKTLKRSPMVLTNRAGVPWTSDGFRASWRKLCAKAQIQDLTFHDLRGSAVTRLALAGAPPQEIAGVTGHSLADVASILDRHYLGDRASLAENAIRRLERKEKRTKAVK